MAREKNWTGKPGERVRSLEVREGGQSAKREMPASQEAEQHVLGCCLVEGSDTLVRCFREKFASDAFFWPENQLIFATMVELYQRGQVVTIDVLAAELTNKKIFEQVGGFPFLMQLTSGVPTTVHASYFIARMKEKWILRELIRESQSAIEGCFDYTPEANGLENLIAPLATRFNRAADYARSTGETMQDRADEGYKRTLLKLEGKHDTSRQIFTGMKEFDSRFGAFDPFEEDWLNGVAALTSGGKSAFTRKIADYNLCRGKKGLIFLLETSIGKWLDLAACTACRINSRQLHNLPADLAVKFRAARLERQNWIGERLWIYDDSLKIEALCARIDDHVRQHGPMDFVVVDHLHELYSSSNKFRGNREPELGYIAKELKKSAKRHNTPYFVPTQLNRSSTKDGTIRRPTKHDLRGSGEIENAFDRLLLLHTPKMDMRNAEQTDNQARVMIEIIQDKSRNGPIGHREFWFDRPYTDYVEIRDHEFQRPANTPGGQAAAGGFGR